MASKLQNTKKNFKKLLVPLTPMLFHSNCFISDFKYKAEIFNDFFSNQCSLINNNSKLPTNLNHVTDRCLSSVTFSAGDMVNLLKTLIQTERIDMTISVFGR